MTLHRTLLLAFILLGLMPSAALSWLSFSRTREAMTNQIEQSLAVQARSLQADIDAMLFERLENALVWSRSELMQDLRLSDVDKRVATYLVGLQEGYGEVYRDLECLSAGDVILASSDMARIGQRAARPDAAALSFEARLPGGTARLFAPASAFAGQAPTITIEVPIAQPFDNSPGAGMRLRLDFDPRQIEHLLDAAAVGHRAIVVVDREGRWIAASARLRQRPPADAIVQTTSRAVAVATSTRVASGLPWTDTPALIGRSHSQATASFAGSGWTTLVLQPEDEALRPVSDMAKIFAGLLVAVLLATLAVATLVASSIAKPIDALTSITRAYRKDGRIPERAPTSSRIAELDILGKAYAEMMQAVERSRQELIRSSKMAMLGELAAVLAHEVRTPLGILRSSAQVLKRNPVLGADGYELMGFIESETLRLNSLVSSMLDTARPRLPIFARCDVHALLRRCAQMHELRREEAGPTQPLLLDLTAGHFEIDADSEQLMQAIFNLLSNAEQAVGPGGRIALSTADEPGALVVACADDGPGIPPELAERVFDPFVSGREGGIGLGLAVVRQVVLAHGGTISIERSAWGGSAFVMRLPRRLAGVDPDGGAS